VERSSLYPDSNEPLGISVLYVGCEAGYVLVMGRDQSGVWQVWFAGQNLYQPLTLPGDVRACGFGQGVNVRSSPSTTASIVTTLAEATLAKAEEFVLTEPGIPATATNPQGLKWGYGWFRVSSPAAGWVYSKYLNGVGGIYSADCRDHDGLESQ
jgi:hypothetical protein